MQIVVGRYVHNCGGNGIRMLVRLVYSEYDSQWFPLSYRFLPPGRSCSVRPETNIRSNVRKNGPNMLA